MKSAELVTSVGVLKVEWPSNHNLTEVPYEVSGQNGIVYETEEIHVDYGQLTTVKVLEDAIEVVSENAKVDGIIVNNRSDLMHVTYSDLHTYDLYFNDS